MYATYSFLLATENVSMHIYARIYVYTVGGVVHACMQRRMHNTAAVHITSIRPACKDRSHSVYSLCRLFAFRSTYMIAWSQGPREILRTKKASRIIGMHVCRISQFLTLCVRLYMYTKNNPLIYANYSKVFRILVVHKPPIQVIKIK